MFFSDIGLVLWLSLPLVVANIVPVFIGSLFGNTKTPIDGGRTWRGHPLLGESKTWEGLAGGIFFAMLWTTVLLVLGHAFGLVTLVNAWGDGDFSPFLHMFTLAFGAHLGDLSKSLVKRQRGIPPGKPWPFFDQFDAVIGGFGLTVLVDWHWFTSQLIPGRWEAVVTLCVVYFLSHRFLSVWSHKMGWKSTAY